MTHPARVRKRRIDKQIADLPLNAISVDRECAEPLKSQIYSSLRDLIVGRVLHSDVSLPSTRILAKDLGVSRNTIIAAYYRLMGEGYLEARPGARTYVVSVAAATKCVEGGSGPVRVEGNLALGARTMGAFRSSVQASSTAGLRPSTPDIGLMATTNWSRLISRRHRFQDAELFGYNHYLGYPPLRQAISSYLQAYRGVRCQPDQIVVTNGAQAALDLTARLTLGNGDFAWVEEPGYHGAQGVILAAGAKLVPLRVDASGWQLSDPPSEQLRLIYTTPSCQMPLGVSMSMEQRRSLLDIAEKTNAWIVEDDFDSEFYLSGAAIPAMQGADAYGRTIYIGSFAKSLFPALRIGFIVFPMRAGDKIEHSVMVSGHFASLPQQAALADFINEGHFARHLRRGRRLYRLRRDRFISLAAHYLGEWLEPYSSKVGIQIAFRFKEAVDDMFLSREANKRQLNVVPLSASYIHGNPVAGFVLGYAALDEKSVKLQLATLATVLSESFARARK